MWELIEPLSTRMHSVKDFLIDICPELEHKVVPISDPFGPTKDDPTMDLLIVSDETVKGGQKVNEGTHYYMCRIQVITYTLQLELVKV